MFSARCPKCGDTTSVSSVSFSTTCKCGQKISAEDFICSHRKEKGECTDPRCAFSKK